MKELINLKLYGPQSGGYFYDLTVGENLKAIAEINIENTSVRNEKNKFSISKFELDPVRDIKAKLLSGKEKLVIAMTLISDPKILL